MARATKCIFEGREIGVEEALHLRDGERGKTALNFKCTECDGRVRPHRAGGSAAAHFEHWSRNPQCQLSHPAPG